MLCMPYGHLTLSRRPSLGLHLLRACLPSARNSAQGSRPFGTPLLSKRPLHAIASLQSDNRADGRPGSPTAPVLLQIFVDLGPCRLGSTCLCRRGVSRTYGAYGPQIQSIEYASSAPGDHIPMLCGSGLATGPGGPWAYKVEVAHVSPSRPPPPVYPFHLLSSTP